MSSPADHPSRADGPPDPAPEGPLAAEAAAAEAATGPGGIAASAGGDASEGGSDAAAGPSPYVYHRHNSMYGYGKRQGDSSGRFRPQYKALILAEQQGLGFDGVASLSEAAAAAHGPWQARLLGRGQLDRETPTETTQCKGAIAALQTLVEGKLIAAANNSWSEVITKLEAAGCAETQLLAADARGAALVPKLHQNEAYDCYLRVAGPDGSVRLHGVGVQYRMPVIKQHWKRERRERMYFKAQAAVVREGQLAALFTGFSLWALGASELPGQRSAAAQPSEGLEEELHLVEEEEGLLPGQLAMEDIQGTEEQTEDYYFSVAGYPRSDNVPDFLIQLLKKARQAQPLRDVSAETGIPHPHRFLSHNQREAARLVEAGISALQPLPPGWELLVQREEGRPPSLLLIPPEGTQMCSLDLLGGLQLGLAEVDLAAMLPVLRLSAAAVGEAASSALQLVEAAAAGASTEGLSDAVQQISAAADAAARWLLQQYTEGAGGGEGAGSAAAAAAAGEGGSARTRRSTAQPPSGPAPKPERFDWSEGQLEGDFDAAVEDLGGLDAAKPLDILNRISHPKLTLRIVQSKLQKKRQRAQGIVGNMLPLPGQAATRARSASPFTGEEAAADEATAAAVAAAATGSSAAGSSAEGARLARNSRQGLPPGTNMSFGARVKGDSARPPASTPLLALWEDERLGRAIVVNVRDASKAFEVADRVAGYEVQYTSLGQLMMRRGQAFLLVQRPRAAAVVFLSADALPPMLFHAAAVVGKGVLAGGSVSPAAFQAAALKSGAALQQQVAGTLLVSSRDATAAAAAKPALARLALGSFLVATHASGISLASGGVLASLSAEEEAAGWGISGGGAEAADEAAEAEAEGAEGAEAEGAGGDAPGGFLATLLQLCPDAAAAAPLRAAADQLLASGLAAPVTLRNDIVHFRARQLRQAGVQLGNHSSAVCAHNSLRKLGGGNADAGARLKAAIDAWQAGLQSLGAGPVPGLASAPRCKEEQWRARVELGWPGAAAHFEAALAAGVQLTQLGSRWTTRAMDSRAKWEGRSPDPALKLNVRRRKRSAVELLKG